MSLNIELNDEQQKVVNANEPFIVVKAAAGSGKTRVLTKRVERLLDECVPPESMVAITFTNMAASEMKERLGDKAKNMFVGTIHAYANYLLVSRGVDTKKWLETENFDKLFELIKEYPECIRIVDYLFVDEAQDLTNQQYEFLIDKVNAKHWFLVGDTRQCQPENTKIQMADGTIKNIEDIKIGDELITYNQKQGHLHGGKSYNALNYKVIDIEHHNTDEELIEVILDNGYTSRYTPGHLVLAQFNDIKENYLVYLMCDKNNRFRIGKSQFHLNNKKECNVYIAKFRAEKCQKMWILKTFNTDKEARIYKDKMSYLFGIPQNTFQLDKTQFTNEDLDFIYDGIDTQNRAEQCLKFNKRDIRYPFLTLNDNKHMSNNSVHIQYACNLLSNNMKMLTYDANTHHRLEKYNITSINYINGPHTVYSLDVETNHTYVADGIITHNCIYRWAGANPNKLIELMRRPEVTTYELRRNYRCGGQILNFARNMIHLAGRDYDDNSICSSGIEGAVLDVEYSPSALAKGIQNHNLLHMDEDWRDWFVLCRSNDEVTKFSKELDKLNIPNITFKQHDLSKKELEEKINENAVKVLTIHASKGLERKNTAVIGARAYNLEEICLCYVAATRAEKMLIWTRPARNKRTRSTISKYDAPVTPWE